MTLLSRLFRSNSKNRSQRPTIGLVGYYGWGNYGDELFKLVLEEALPSVRFVHLHTMTQPPYFPSDFDRRLAAVDAVLIGGGDLLIPWSVSPLYWNRAFLRKPVFIYGIGVPTWGGIKDTCVAHYKEFLSHPAVQAIVARDPESMAWIRQHLTPEPSKLSWAPDIVCAADFEDKAFAENSRIFGLITRAHEQAFHDNLIATCELAASRGYAVHHIVLATGQTKNDDLAEARQLPFPNQTLVVRDDIHGLTEELARCRVIASMKFHGCVTAAMLGIPVLSLSRVDKFVSFYKLLDQPDFISDVRDKALPDKLSQAMDSAVPKGVIAELRQQARSGLKNLEEIFLQANRR